MFDQITIIGCGLIGSSLLRAIDKKKLSKKVNVFDKSKEVQSFIKNNLEYFKTNPRLAVMPRALERLKDERKEIIFNASNTFLSEKTK